MSNQGYQGVTKVPGLTASLLIDYNTGAPLCQEGGLLNKASPDVSGVGKSRWATEGTTRTFGLIEAGGALPSAWSGKSPKVVRLPGEVTGRASSIPPGPSTAAARAAAYKDYVALTFLGTNYESKPNEAVAHG